MTTPEVSIVIPNFNKRMFLAAAVDSVLAQGPSAEAIFVDDASTDGSAAILAHAAERNSRLRLIQAPSNIGGSACRNLGLEAAQGEFVIFMDSDDLLAAGCCERRVQVARKNPGHDLWIFPMDVFRDDPSHPIDRWLPREGDHLAHFLAHRLDWHTMQPLWRADFIRSIGGFDAEFPRLQDPEVHTKAILHGARIALFPDMPPDCLYRVAPERHESDVTDLAERHVAGVLLYCRKFAPLVDAERLPLLSGTLLACQGVLLHWWRAGRLGADTLDRMHKSLLDACVLPRHRIVLDLAFRIQRRSPIHVRGLRAMTKGFLRLP